MKNIKNNFEENIMKQIRNGKFNLRSKYLFLAEKIGSICGFVLFLFLSIFFINLIFYFLKTADILEYLNFGSSGLPAFLESFPSFFLLGGIMSIFATGYFIAKNDISYKQPFIYIVFALIIVVVSSGEVMASSGINDKLEQFSQKNGRVSFLLRPIFNREIKNKNRGIAGAIVEINDDSLILKTINGSVVLVPDKVKVNALKSFLDLKFQEGDMVVAIGKMIKGEFNVLDIKSVDKNKAPLIRKRIVNNQFNIICDLNRNGVLDKIERERCDQVVRSIEKKCGNEICDKIEKNNSLLCPQDCLNN